MKINYVIGDATQPHGEGKKIIPHVVNNKGRWGAGFVLALSNKWSHPEQYYRAREIYPLGEVDFIQVEDDIIIANMIAQHDTRPNSNGIPPIRYGAVREALSNVNAFALEIGATLHAPMFGAGLSGGKWNIIEKIIEDVVTVPVTIYVLNEKDLPQKVV